MDLLVEEQFLEKKNLRLGMIDLLYRDRPEMGEDVCNDSAVGCICLCKESKVIDEEHMKESRSTVRNLDGIPKIGSNGLLDGP